jgi:hypothetical protein
LQGKLPRCAADAKSLEAWYATRVSDEGLPRAQIRQRPPRVSGPPTAVVVGGVIAGALVIGYGVYRGWQNAQRTYGPKVDPAAEAEERRNAAEQEAAFTTALDALVAAPVALTTEPCTTKPMVPIELGRMSLAWSGPRLSGAPGDDTSGYLMKYLRFTGSNGVVPMPASGAPFEKVVFPGVPPAVLLVDRWVDPVVPVDVVDKTSFTVGQIDARVFVWDRAAKRFACGAKVTAQNANVTIVTTTSSDYSKPSTTEDSLSKVRVDLVNEAFRAGLTSATVIAP